MTGAPSESVGLRTDTSNASESGSTAVGLTAFGKPLLLPELVDPRLHLAIVVVTLQVLGQTVFDFDVSVAQILLTIGICGTIDLVLTLGRDGVIAWPASALLTGNGIALILRVPGTEHGDWWSLQGWWIFMGAGALAMASKYLIRVNGDHIFNPSNFALVVAFVVLGQTRADPQVLWWGPLSPGLVLAFTVILGGSVVITRRVGQGMSALSYWAVFAGAVAMIAATGHSITANWHVGPISGFDYWVLLVTSPEVLVFLFFMITDPKTAPSERHGQVIYGSAIAVVGALIIATQSGEFGTKVGILAGLTLVSPFVVVIRSGAPAWATTRRFGLWMTGAVLACLAAVLLVASSTRGPETAPVGSAERRAEFPIDMDSLPEVSIDPTVEQFSVDLDQVAAEDLAHDIVQGLRMEAASLESGDRELAETSLTGRRLAQVRDAIDSGATGPEVDYEFDSLTATAERSSSGFQDPPNLALQVEGSLVIDGEPEALAATYVIRRAGEEYLIADAHSFSGEQLLPPSIDPARLLAAQPDAGIPAAPDNRPEDIPEPWQPEDPALGGLDFTEVSEQAGLNMPFSAERYLEHEDMTSGASVADIDRDDDLDLFIGRRGLPDLLMINDGTGRFHDIAARAGVAGPDDGQGSAASAFADFDGDGSLDLFVTGAGSRANRLYMNQGNNTFVEESSSRGLAWPTLEGSEFGNQVHDAVVADVNRDGAMDLLVLQWWLPVHDAQSPEAAEALTEYFGDEGPGEPYFSACAVAEALREAGSPTDPSAEPNRSGLYLNDGEGHFEDAADKMELPLDEIVAFTGVFNDLDGDGWQDLTVAGDYCTSRVFRNVEGERFEDITQTSGTATDENAMGSVVADIDLDGDPDWFVTSISHPTSGARVLQAGSGNRLYLNDGSASFTDATDEYGLRDSGWGWGAAVADFDNDGIPEVSATNGFDSALIEDGSAPPGYENTADATYLSSFEIDRTRLWYRDGEVYRDAAGAVGIDDTSIGHGLVSFDMDGDGDLDLLITPSDAPPLLYRNDTPPVNHWIRVALDDDETPGNSWGDGARVEVTVDEEDDPLVGWISTGGSYESQKPPEFHAGLGDHGDQVERIEVFWPGEQDPQVLENVEPDRVVTVRRST